MPNPSNDDVAKALERLATGQADEPAPPSDDVSHLSRPVNPAPQTPPVAARPIVPARPPGPKAVPQPRPVAGRPAGGAAASRPLQPPGSAAPPAPRPPGASTPATQPSPTARPSAPQPGSPPAARPSAPPVVRAEEPAPVVQTEVIDDDDQVIVPAPAADVFMHRSSGPAAARASAHKGLSLRRTFIPILLTAGFILFALGVLRSLWQGNNPLLGLQPWLVAVMFVFALALWGLAAVNMLAVKHQLSNPRG